MKLIFLSFGKPNNAEVVITPAKFKSGFLIASDNTNKPPKLCPYKNNGKSLLAYLNNTSIS